MVILIVGSFLLVVGLVLFLPLLFAKYHAVKFGKSEVNLFNGWVKLILWLPKEGIVVLRNKRVMFVDEKGEGGTRYIYPVRGDELRERVPLGVQMLTWEDDRILTRESLQIHMKVVV